MKNQAFQLEKHSSLFDEDEVPEGDHDGVDDEEDGEPEPEEGVKLLVDHVQGQHAQTAVHVHATSCASSEMRILLKAALPHAVYT
jgi:hypothetical protein